LISWLHHSRKARGELRRSGPSSPTWFLIQASITLPREVIPIQAAGILARKNNDKGHAYSMMSQRLAPWVITAHHGTNRGSPIAGHGGYFGAAEMLTATICFQQVGSTHAQPP
jgi:hypothetical protein